MQPITLLRALVRFGERAIQPSVAQCRAGVVGQQRHAFGQAGPQRFGAIVAQQQHAIDLALGP